MARFRLTSYRATRATEQHNSTGELYKHDVTPLRQLASVLYSLTVVSAPRPMPLAMHTEDDGRGCTSR
jgi:hypothetical protein